MRRWTYLLALVFLVCNLPGNAFGRAAQPRSLAFNPFAGVERECARLACNVEDPQKVRVARDLSTVFNPARPCCSRNEGSCGCAGTHLICCDGTLSRNCGCD